VTKKNESSSSPWHQDIRAGRPSNEQARHQAEEAQELADNLLGLLIALSRHGASNDGERLALLQRVTLALAARVAERGRNIGGRKQAAAFSAALVQAAYCNSGNNK
jgi:hypothetical protein